jgi:hypothetical protein
MNLTLGGIGGVVALILLASIGEVSAGEKELQQSADSYRKRYPLTDTSQKLVSNEGTGFKALEGVRNFRAVLPGIVYRGGANNDFRSLYDPSKPNRATESPLPPEGLDNLCKEGFGEAIYLYNTKNMPDQKVSIECNVGGEKKSIIYERLPPLGSKINTKAILKMVHAKLTGTNYQPVYMHCWNGWHASGFISAIVLRQFCGADKERAVSYWDANIEKKYDPKKMPKRYLKIRDDIRNFTPIPELAINDEVKMIVCPQL